MLLYSNKKKPKQQYENEEWRRPSPRENIDAAISDIRDGKYVRENETTLCNYHYGRLFIRRM